MGALTYENLQKLNELKARLVEEGLNVPEDTKDENSVEGFIEDKDTKEDTLRISDLSKEEKEAIEETVKVWGISFSQATMIYRSVGTIQGLQISNLLRKKLQSKELTYERINKRLQDGESVTNGVEILIDRYFRNYERILGGEEFPVKIALMRHENENIEKKLVEMRPQAERAAKERDALCATLYYGMMTDLAHAKESQKREKEEYRRQENDKLLPNFMVEIEE